MTHETRSRPGAGVWREDEAERRLAATCAQVRALDVARARDLAILARARHYRLVGCAGLAEYGRRFGLRPCETWDRAKCGMLLLLHPELEEDLLTGRISFQAGAALYDVVSLADESAPAWVENARVLPTTHFTLRVEEHLAARKLGAPPVRMALLVSPLGKRVFERAKEIAERKCDRALSDGEALEAIADDYVERHDPPRQAPKQEPAPGPTESSGRYIPLLVRLFVRQRDHDRCAVPGCARRGRVHFSHIVAFRKGGQPVPGNILLLCPVHNQMMEYGLLRIEGTADAPRFFDSKGLPYVVKRVERPPREGAEGRIEKNE